MSLVVDVFEEAFGSSFAVFRMLFICILYLCVCVCVSVCSFTLPELVRSHLLPDLRGTEENAVK